MSITAGLAGVSGVWHDVYIIRKFVEMLKDELVMPDYAEAATIPKHLGGYVARWNVPESYHGSTTVITEASAGTVGERTSTTINTVESTINTYMEFMKLGEIAKASMIEGTMDVFLEQFTFAGASAIERLLQAAAETTTTFLHSGDTVAGGATLADGDYATLSDFNSIAGIFWGNNAKGFKSLGGDFVWIMHPNQELKLTTEFTTLRHTWTDVAKESAPGYNTLVKNHRLVGRYGSVTALRSTMITTVSEDITIAYKSYALAKYGVGWAGLGERGPSAPEIIYKTPGKNDTSQPGNLYDTLAWKVKLAAALLDAKRCMIVYSDGE